MVLLVEQPFLEVLQVLELVPVQEAERQRQLPVVELRRDHLVVDLQQYQQEGLLPPVVRLLYPPLEGDLSFLPRAQHAVDQQVELDFFPCL